MDISLTLNSVATYLSPTLRSGGGSFSLCSLRISRYSPRTIFRPSAADAAIGAASCVASWLGVSRELHSMAKAKRSADHVPAGTRRTVLAEPGWIYLSQRVAVLRDVVLRGGQGVLSFAALRVDGRPVASAVSARRWDHFQLILIL